MIHAETTGWFPWEAAAIWDFLLRYQRTSGIRGDLLELGVWQGKSGVMLAMAAEEGETAILVDHRIRRKDLKKTFARAPKRAWDATRFVECDTRDLHGRPELEGRNFRFVHIDAEHSVAAMRSDLDLAHQTMTDDGIVCLDDIFVWLYPQLTDEMFRYLRAHPDRFSLVLLGYKKAFLARPAKARAYMDHCHAHLIDDLDEIGIESCLARTARMEELTGFSIGGRHGEPRHRGRDGDNDHFEY